MRSKCATVLVALLSACALVALRAEAASKPQPASLTITNAPASTGPYSGSQCESNTYSGQCPGGDCQCLVVSGNFCSGKVGPRSRKNQACSLFMTIDKGLATGSPGCSPLFAVIQGFIENQSEGFIVGTICVFSSKSSNFSGGLVLDTGAGFSSGEGLVTGTTDGTLSLKVKGTLTPQ